MKSNKPRILIVDDSLDQQNMLTEMLIDRYDILSAFNGNQALQIAKGKPAPDLILMDIIIPPPDGYQVCSLLKSDEKTNDIPVILISGLGGYKLKKKSAEAGAEACLQKPFTMSELFRILDRQFTALSVS